MSYRRPYRLRATTRSVLLAPAVVCLLWVCCITLYGSPSCSDLNTRCTGTALIRTQPYCFLDPTCATPNLTGCCHYSSVDGWSYIHWHGFAIRGDPESLNGNLMQLLAIPNFCLFVLSSLGCLWLGLVLLRQPGWRRAWFAAVATWYTLEVFRWCWAVLRLSQHTVGSMFLIEPFTYLVVLALLLPMLTVSIIVLPTLRVGYTH
jgi:hypothetical protein